MKAMLVIQTSNGYAAAPYNGPVPDNFVPDMKVAAKITSYSYAHDTVAKALDDYFEPEEPAVETAAPVKEAA